MNTCGGGVGVRALCGDRTEIRVPGLCPPAGCRGACRKINIFGGAIAVWVELGGGWTGSNYCVCRLPLNYPRPTKTAGETCWSVGEICSKGGRLKTIFVRCASSMRFGYNYIKYPLKLGQTALVISALSSACRDASCTCAFPMR